MVYTSSYYDVDSSSSSFTVSITRDKGKKAKYKGTCFPELREVEKLSKRKYQNIGNSKALQEEYISNYYTKVLMNLDPKKIYNALDNKILLSYEGNDEFSHRLIIAAWFELYLGKNTKEVKIKDRKYIYLENKYYDDVKRILEKVIKQKISTNGYDSLRAYYLDLESKKMARKSQALLVENHFKLPNRAKILSIKSLKDAKNIESNHKKRIR